MEGLKAAFMKGLLKTKKGDDADEATSSDLPKIECIKKV